jgi:nucleoside-diphosphate-sugar epimerase
MSTPQHVMFGTGAIGLALLEALRRRGETVRLVNHSGHARLPSEVIGVSTSSRDRSWSTAARSAFKPPRSSKP